MERRELFRLSTFHSWPIEAKVSPLTLARRGFFYTATGNAIRCEACNTMLDHVEQLDSTLERHKEQSPGCPYLLPASAPNIPCNPPDLALAIAGLTVTDGGGPDGSMQGLMSTYMSAAARAKKHGVFPANTGSNLEPTGPVSSQAAHVDPSTQVPVSCEREQPNYEQLQREESRMLTFNNWPVTACIDFHDLAEGGFFYTGQDDRVQCAFCRGYLKNWKAGDVVQIKHQKYFPNCPYLLRMAASGGLPQPCSQSSGDSANHQVVSEVDQVSALMDREELRILLPIIQNLGFNENDLRTVVAERLSKGEDCLVPTKVLEALFQGEREN